MVAKVDYGYGAYKGSVSFGVKAVMGSSVFTNIDLTSGRITIIIWLKGWVNSSTEYALSNRGIVIGGGQG